MPVVPVHMLKKRWGVYLNWNWRPETYLPGYLPGVATGHTRSGVVQSSQSLRLGGTSP